MAKRETKQEKQKRVLILCVDRDGDIETKAKLKTPLLGRTTNVEGAVTLALNDPEEPDANAMFEAVRLYDRMVQEKQPNEVIEIATLAGSDLGGVNADRKLSAELESLIKTFEPTEAILVSDGYSDEAVLPLISSRVPVSSIRRIVIKHSESIEETAAVFTKYIRMLVDDPRYARVALGLPGILVLVFGILWAINRFIPDAITWYGIIIAIIFGGFLLLKGFGADRKAKDFYIWVRDYTPPPLPIQISNYAVIAGILCVAVSIYLGVANVIRYVPFSSDPSVWLNLIPLVANYFIKGVQTLLIIGIDIVLSGRCVRLYAERDSRLLRNGAFIVTVTWFWWILDATATLLVTPLYPDVAFISFANTAFADFILKIIVGILIGIASILLVYIANHSVKDFFKKDTEAENPEATHQEQ
ncbi:MAG: DUF373 family protein [Nitrososphaerota archaeon]|jgi:putative membrane protein|nr:DUF373 family protein [Nitrososphaerota archaeon]